MMGSSYKIIIIAMCCALSSVWPSSVAHRTTFDPHSLDSFIHDFVFKNTTWSRSHRTGRIDDVVLPFNFSGIEASVFSLRSSSLWRRGANLSNFHIPPSVLPWPFVRRLDLVFENLANWSSSYFNVPNHTFVSPVIGLLAYDANNRSDESYGKIELRIMKDPILVHFPYIALPEVDKNGKMKCVRFGTNGTFEFSDMSLNRMCIVRGIGHFSLVIPTSTQEKKNAIWKWWVIGLGVGIAGLVLLICMSYMIYKVVKVKRIGNMERQSEKSVSVGTVWVGRSKMPCASSIRTQPVLENSYVP